MVTISIFVLGVVLKYFAYNLAHDSEEHKPNYFIPPAVTSIVFALFCNLVVLNLREYIELFLATIFVLVLADKHIFRSRFGGYIVASYIGMWLSASYAVYFFFVR